MTGGVKGRGTEVTIVGVGFMDLSEVVVSNVLIFVNTLTDRTCRGLLVFSHFLFIGVFLFCFN